MWGGIRKQMWRSLGSLPIVKVRHRLGSEPPLAIRGNVSRFMIFIIHENNIYRRSPACQVLFESFMGINSFKPWNNLMINLS